MEEQGQGLRISPGLKTKGGRPSTYVGQMNFWKLKRHLGRLPTEPGTRHLEWGHPRLRDRRQKAMQHYKEKLQGKSVGDAHQQDEKMPQDLARGAVTAEDCLSRGTSMRGQ